MFRVIIETGNDVFAGDPSVEVVRILRDAADHIDLNFVNADLTSAGTLRRTLMDANGSRVGFWEARSDDSFDKDKDPTWIESSYAGCPGTTIQDAAMIELRTALRQMEDGATDHTGREQRRAVQFQLSGGGPSSWVTFVLDSAGDPEEGWLSYYEPHGSAVVPIPSWAVNKLFKALRAYGR